MCVFLSAKEVCSFTVSLFSFSVLLSPLPSSLTSFLPPSLPSFLPSPGSFLVFFFSSLPFFLSVALFYNFHVLSFFLSFPTRPTCVFPFSFMNSMLILFIILQHRSFLLSFCSLFPSCSFPPFCPFIFASSPYFIPSLISFYFSPFHPLSFLPSFSPSFSPSFLCCINVSSAVFVFLPSFLPLLPSHTDTGTTLQRKHP